jgi:hypothetical protein
VVATREQEEEEGAGVEIVTMGEVVNKEVEVEDIAKTMNSISKPRRDAIRR